MPSQKPSSYGNLRFSFKGSIIDLAPHPPATPEVLPPKRSVENKRAVVVVRLRELGCEPMRTLTVLEIDSFKHLRGLLVDRIPLLQSTALILLGAGAVEGTTIEWLIQELDLYEYQLKTCFASISGMLSPAEASRRISTHLRV